jgi:hypothetical protein
MEPSSFQVQKIKELKALGWIEVGSQTIRGPGRVPSRRTFTFSNSLGLRVHVGTSHLDYDASAVRRPDAIVDLAEGN